MHQLVGHAILGWHGNVESLLTSRTFHKEKARLAEEGIGQWSTLCSAALSEVTPLWRQVDAQV